MAAACGLHIGTVFAMHDSNLGVNTWLASDNSTQRHTIDLNNGPSSSSAEAGAATASDTATDENGDETGSDVMGEEGGNGEEDSEDGDGDSETIFQNRDD